DPASPWTAEARRHLAALQKSDARAFDPQTAREEVVDTILPEWARARQQDATGDALLERAAAITRQIERVSPDRFVTQVLDAVARNRTSAALRTALLDGHVRFGAARASYRASKLPDALTQFTTAAAQ